MAEKPAYKWQSMDYKEISFLDKNLNASNPEQAALKQELRAYTSGRVSAFAKGEALIQNAAEYKLIHSLIGDQNLNGSAQDGGEASLQALQAFARVKGFKNTSTGELDFYDPRSGMTADEFKESMLKPVHEQAPVRKPDSVSGMEVGDKKEIGGSSISQAAAEKMQEQMAQILDTQKDMDAGAVQSMQEEIIKQAEGGNAKAPFAAPENVAEKTNEERELEKGKTDENALGTDLSGKHFEINAINENSAEKVRDRQISEGMLAKETENWQEFAETNGVLAETVQEDKAVVTKIFEGLKEQEKGEYNAIIERYDNESVNIGGGKKDKEPDLRVFKQIAKNAKMEGHDSISISPVLSPEAKEKGVIAAVSEGMNLVGPEKPKSIDLKRKDVKKLSPAERSKLRRYNVSNMTPEELKKYRRDRKVLLKTGRRKKAEAVLSKAQGMTNTLTQSLELGMATRGKMGPQNDGGRGM